MEVDQDNQHRDSLVDELTLNPLKRWTLYLLVFAYLFIYMPIVIQHFGRFMNLVMLSI